MLQVVNYLMTHTTLFMFDGKFFLQKKRVSMGAKYSPSFANLVMTQQEELDSMYFRFCHCMHWYSRYIDDLLITWQGAVSAISVFMEYFNTKVFNLKFTLSCHATQISFLDLSLKGKNHHAIISATFGKPTIVPATQSKPQNLSGWRNSLE